MSRPNDWGRIAPVLASLALFACDGVLLDGAAGPAGAGRRGGGPVSCGDGSIVLGTAPMRRLSNAEYLHTLRDLFPGVTPAVPELPEDTEVGGFENDARSLGPSDVRVSRWEDIAFRYAGEVTSSPDRLAAFLPCAPGAGDAGAQRACGETLVRDFGRRAYRRPLSDQEVERYVAFFESQREAIDFAAAVQLTTMALLQSPWFLYRIELPGEGGGDGVVPLDGYQLASRLSYFLWESTPDDALLEAAARGELATDAQLEAQARRMLDDGRAREAVVDFHRQWLDFDRIEMDEHQGRVPELYPTWNETLRQAVRDEQDRFVEGVLFDGEGTLRALLTSRTAYVNGPLASLYGVNGPGDATTWEEVTLPHDQRAGLLTRAGFLASHAHSGNGSPPLRGVFVMERLLCEPRPSPPPDADLTPPVVRPGEEPRTNRQLFEERTSPAGCIACHTRIDGFGFGFEHYDAVGGYRELDHGLPVDASGNLTGTDVDGPYVGAIELSEALAESARVEVCATRMWMRYALGRAPEREDECLTSRLARSFHESGGDVRALMVDIVTSPEFRNRPLASE
ncbi:DUF1592 domain-containing protein [Sandaracinus amylolyticus]|uniref:Cellulose-binding domain protein n=1 Tax=Sandaracinus amylolyticus TaxID=927083 RepID=A0A0F6YGN9_9BACT|nr:DUF1592 domain-containing protein [Sandaracinus amylolyticus]AKF04922.1 Cellulose-binding domain protein [Sandaracinus amylolyticus]